jgi:hypothetical protein
VIDALDALVREVGWDVPPGLAAAAGRLERTAWPEVVGRWSRLTPTGFPIELTVARDALRRWTSEVAGPEVAEASRLGLVAEVLGEAGTPVPAGLLDSLRAHQSRGTLRYGAWLGGRSPEGPGPARYKLYAEVPRDAALDVSALPGAMRRMLEHTPGTGRVRMIGVEPARHRCEVYLRLDPIEPEDLRPLFSAAGCGSALDILEAVLPDGTRRLRGRPLGLSIASADGAPAEVSLTMAARSFFPGSPQLLAALVPAMASLRTETARPTVVTMRLSPASAAVGFAVGVTARNDFSRSDGAHSGGHAPCHESPSARAGPGTRGLGPGALGWNDAPALPSGAR